MPRSEEYGRICSKMRTVLPHAKFVAFTGIPISKEDKSTLAEFYGDDYIDVYTIMESVADGATVELLYDEGIAKLDVKKEALDREFEEKFGHLSAEKKDRLKRVALLKYQLSSERIEAISKHMIDHYAFKIYPDGHKAMIVYSGREAAIKYQQKISALRDSGYQNFVSRVVISIGAAKSDDIARDYYASVEWNKKHRQEKRPIWIVPPEDVKTITEDFKLPFGDESVIEKSGKKKYDNTALIIVSDMLLTGYDVPIASCLYLDKPLKEHNLLQAIARVNRSGKGKKAGFVIDYNGITAYLIQALEIFSGDIRPDDILKNLNEEIPKLELHHAKLVDLFRPLKADRGYERDTYIDAALRYIESIDRRDEFKILLKHFNKSIAVVLPHVKAMRYRRDFKLYNEIKLRASNIYLDDDGLKISKDESKMLQDMIDERLTANGVMNMFEDPISIIDKDKFKEEIMNASPATKELKMRNHLRHTIKVGLDKNPDIYKPLAQRLEELLELKRAQRMDEAQLILAYAAVQDQIIDELRESEEKGFDTARKRAIYSSMKVILGDKAEDATNTLFDLIKGEVSIIGWKDKGMVLNDIENKVSRFLNTAIPDREQAKAKAIEIVQILRSNVDA